MSEENGEHKPQYDPTNISDHIDNMYETWFLDYASYVILERAVPSIVDGLKPVQTRIMHALKEMDDGRFHKVANVIGQTMQYHPHGDAAIGDALVNLGQKNLLLDTQGNWGDIRTGDSAAAARYIETRLSKFALDVVFNPDTTEWQLSYDGRKREPVDLPVKFPLLLAQGVEGIAVGLSTKILPHNFNELIAGSINVLKGKKTNLMPDFPTGGFADCSNYNGGLRGGKVRVRAKIEARDKNTLVISELPYGLTTGSLIDSIIKASDKGKIKVKKVMDNTAKDVEIVVELPKGITTDKAIDALYAFTKCEESISPLACVIIDDKPVFMDINEMLRISTMNTLELLRKELEIERDSLNQKWHNASLEKIFIENRIYRDIEECETWEAVIEAIDVGMHKFVSTPSRPSKAKGRIKLKQDITEEDIVRLTEIKIKRISKFDSFKADEGLKRLEEGLKKVADNLNNLTDYAIDYFKELKKKYGKGRERKTKLIEFDKIDSKAVAASNVKMYVDKAEGFIGTSLKKDEFLFDCSDIDDVIIFKKDGSFVVTRVDAKTFVGKGIMEAYLWKKGDSRTTYNMIYTNMDNKVTYVKRFQIPGVTYDKEYSLTGSAKKAKIQYFSVNPNAEAEIVNVVLHERSSARKKEFDYDFASIDIKSRGAKGNILTKYPVRKINLKESGKSTIGGMHLWVDEGNGRVNKDEYGAYLGEFFGSEEFLILYKDGHYEIKPIELGSRIDVAETIDFGIVTPNTVVSAVYFDAKKKAYYVKRFQLETNRHNQKYRFIGETEKNVLHFASLHPSPIMKFTHEKGKQKEKIKEEISLQNFIEVKGWKAAGNKLNFNKPTALKFELPELAENTAQEILDVDQEDDKATESKPVENKTVKKTVKKKDELTAEASNEIVWDLEAPKSKPKSSNKKGKSEQGNLFDL